METLRQTFTEYQIYGFSTLLENWMYVISGGLLFLEILKFLFKKLMNWKLAGDGMANFVTYAAFVLLYYTVLGSIFITVYYSTSYFAIATIPMTTWSIVLCIVLADFAYYCEHRFSHRTGIGWSSHTVHHSSPYFNITVAYRFGPLDGLIPIAFHLPLILAGFHPALVFVAEAIVLLYQTPLHTELVGKLPKPIEWIFNTPSHHRVHHGRNAQYIDKNYGGIFIIWDRMFGTFEEEIEKVEYGISDPINSVNPFIVWFHGLARLIRKMASARRIGDALNYLIKPPSWTPEKFDKTVAMKPDS